MAVISLAVSKRYCLIVAVPVAVMLVGSALLSAGAAQPHKANPSRQLAQLDAALEGAIPPEAVQLNDAGVKAVGKQDYKLAISKLEAAVKLAPSYKMALENLAIAYNNYGLQLKSKPLESIKQFHKAVYLDPQNETTVANYEGIIGFLRKNPKSFDDRVALGDQAMAAGDLFGGVIEYSNALRIQDDEAVRSKFSSVTSKLNGSMRSSGLPNCSYWEALAKSPTKERTIKPGILGWTGAKTAKPATTPGPSPSTQEVDKPLEHAREFFQQYVLASNTHNPDIVNYYAKVAVFAMGGSDPHSLTAKMEIPAAQWKSRYLARQRADGVANRQDRFENVTYLPDKGAVRISFTRVDPQVAARVEWLVKPDSDRKWRIFEQVELAVPNSGARK